MRPVSNAFLETVRGSHVSAFRAQLLPFGQVGVSPTGGTPVDLIAGNVIFDTKADVNGTVEAYVSYAWPELASDPITPYGNEIFIERGVQYGEGQTEWVSLGYFRIDSVEQDYQTGQIRITGSDRMSRVRDYRPTQPWVFLAGTSVELIVESVVGDALGGAAYVWDEDMSLVTVTSDHVLDDDRIQFLRELLTAYGKIFYFDYAGRFVVRDQPVASEGSSVWDVNSGRYGVLVSMRRSISRDSVYNVVVARGEPIGTQPPVQGYAEDTNPDSPTYANGQFGRVPRFFSSSFLTTTLQCTQTAASLLSSSTGLPYIVELGSIPNPALEGWDVVTVVYTDAVAPETHVIDSIYYPLSVEEPMVMTSRKQF